MKNFQDQFLLNPAITFLNFGSFGATPKPIFENYQHWQRVLEAEPVQFIAFDGFNYLAESRAALAKYIGCADQDDLVYVTNPSFAINLIAKNFPLKAGDEILTTDIEYGACDRTWNFYCEKAGATYRRQKINLPITTKEKFIADFFEGVTANTKAIFISQITSSTGLIFPVKEVCEIAKSKGLITIVDGAHVPGHIPFNLGEIQADFYTGACHKWMMTPKGSSFLYVKNEHQHLFDPLIVSWGYQSTAPSQSQFLDYHQMQGTRDFSAFLCIPNAIEFMQQNNWSAVSKTCKEMVQQNAPRFCKLLKATPTAPITDDFICQLYSTPIKTKQPLELHRHFFNQYKIEVPVMPHGDNVFLRYSIQAFNTQNDLDKLYNAVEDIIKTTSFIEV